METSQDQRQRQMVSAKALQSHRDTRNAPCKERVAGLVSCVCLPIEARAPMACKERVAGLVSCVCLPIEARAPMALQAYSCLRRTASTLAACGGWAGRRRWAPTASSLPPTTAPCGEQRGPVLGAASLPDCSWLHPGCQYPRLETLPALPTHAAHAAHAAPPPPRSALDLGDGGRWLQLPAPGKPEDAEWSALEVAADGRTAYLGDPMGFFELVDLRDKPRPVAASGEERACAAVTRGCAL